MYANMAHAPGLLKTYFEGYLAFRTASGFTPTEQEVVFLVVSKLNGCHYCVAAHSMVADKRSNLDPAVTTAIRNGNPIADPRLAALARFTARMVEARGHVSPADGQAFLAAGYSEPQTLRVVFVTAVKTLSNYSNHVFHTAIDQRFVDYA